jgi:signal transduction histidine kinase
MFDFFQKSLRNKLFFTFLFIGFLPFITLLIYTLYLSETKIVNKIINEQYERTDSITKQINNQLDSLKKEVSFIASLDVMDDILADDIDKRISRLLSKKSNDLNLKNNFMVINSSSVIIASSTASDILKKLDIKKITKDNSGTYMEDKTLYIYSKINASFNKAKEIGFLVLRYDLDNLDVFLTHKLDTHSYIMNPYSGLDIGNQISFDLNYTKHKNSLITSEHLIVYKQMNSIFKDWYIVYAVDKSVALVFLYDFIRFMLYISIPIFIIIIFISIKYARGIVKPIEELTFTTDKITNTRNYSAQLSIKSKDEIGTLTNSFNDMLKTTSSALYKLEEENKLRLKRFTQLIEVFNTIIQTKDEKECIDTSIDQIKVLTDKKNLSFHTNKIQNTDKSQISLFVTDFEKNEQVHFGFIELGLDKIDDVNERKFYDSIGTMITLQLDRIRLIERTMAASRAKSAFISNMSHELRTPLNAIIGFSQFLIAYEELSDDQQDTVANIESSAHYLLSMINEILDIAKIEAGKMEAHVEDTNILELVKSTHTMLLPLANDKNLNFNLITDNFIDKEYRTDPKMFKQIVVNLISNAIKFTQEGFVSLELYNDKESLYVKVKDSGIGISQDDIKRLFNDFTQVENVMQKKHKGTGLGLSLSKKMANILGGDIILESDGLDKGTTSLFSIKI